MTENSDFSYPRSKVLSFHWTFLQNKLIKECKDSYFA